MRSQMAKISSNRWVMKITAMPFSFRLRMMRNRIWVSFSVSEEVGSSMMTTLALMLTALMLSTICCWAMLSLRTSS